MTDKPHAVCPNCGARVESQLGLGPMYFIPDTGYAQLHGLFNNLFDEYRCRACGTKMDHRPSLVLGINNWQERFYFLGDWFTDAPTDLQNNFLNEVLTKDVQAEAFANLDHLRAAYTKRILVMVERFNSMVQEIGKPGALEEYLKDGWRSFTSNHFTAAALALTTPLPGVSISFPRTIDESVNDIVTSQILVWHGLCASWSAEPEAGRTIEGDFALYFEPNATFIDAAKTFLEQTENLENDVSIGFHFCVEAMRATLYAWSNKPNPRLSEWADMYVQQELERRIFAGKSPPLLMAMEISATRAKATIPYEELFEACLRRVQQDFRLRPQLGDIGRKLEYPDLEQELLVAAQLWPSGTVQTVEQALAQLRASWKGGPPEALLPVVSKVVESVDKLSTVESLVVFADGLKDILGDELETKGLIAKWLSSHLHKKNLPKMVLERIGDKAQSWEHELTLGTRAALWTERSNALRMTGHVQEALTIAEAVISEIEAAGQATPPELRRNLAILYRESGRHEEALDILLKLRVESPRDLKVLNSLVVTYGSLGRVKEMIFYSEAMLKLATGLHADKRPAIISTLASAKAYIGKFSEALGLVREVNLETTDDLSTLVAFGSAWITLMTSKREIEEEDSQRIETLIAKLENLSDITAKSANVNLNQGINLLLALLFDLTDKRPNSYWSMVDANARKFEGSPDPLANLALARDAWKDGSAEKGRTYLLELPSAVTKRFGQGRDTSLRIGSLSKLSMLSTIVAERVVRSGSLEDLRLFAEVTRDMLGRIELPPIVKQLPSSGFIAPSAADIARLGGPTAVFEWVEGYESLYGLATFVDADGRVTESYLHLPEINLPLLADRMNQRLSLWRADRPGSPLDLKEWQLFERWLAKELDGHLTDGGQLVVIEHKAVAGLQWHLAAAPRWRVSYAPSWSALLSLRRSRVQPTARKVGLAMVPKYRESKSNIEALEGSVADTKQLATESGFELKSASGEDCDREALMMVLEETTVAKVLCHGFVDPDDNIVALMVAHDNELPLGNSVAANTSFGRRHRFDWRDCQKLKSAPDVFFSAACGSGQSHHAGFGETLGLFSTLRRAGTRAVVAPRWDIEPKVVLPILDNAMRRYLATGIGLGGALHEACIEAGSELPRSQAWALALEGDWK